MMRFGDWFREITYYRERWRTHDWAHHQSVSLLDLTDLNLRHRGGRRKLARLWRCGVRTADDLLVADPQELAGQLASCVDWAGAAITPLEWVRARQAEIRSKLAQIEASKESSNPEG